jgi:hypothetical protein
MLSLEALIPLELTRSDIFPIRIMVGRRFSGGWMEFIGTQLALLNFMVTRQPLLGVSLSAGMDLVALIGGTVFKQAARVHKSDISSRALVY